MFQFNIWPAFPQLFDLEGVQQKIISRSGSSAGKPSPEQRAPGRSIKEALLSRSTGPGGLYNVGNLIALAGGVSVQTLSMGDTQSFGAMLSEYFFGSPATTCLTLAVLVFLASGEVYHKAWQRTGIAAQNRVRAADALSGLAAILLTIALVKFGDAQLGLLAGLMLIIGKFGTALLPERADAHQIATRLTQALRMLVVASRIPSLIALGFPLLAAAQTSTVTLDTVMTLVMTLCHLLWLWADLLLVALSRRVNTA